MHTPTFILRLSLAVACIAAVAHAQAPRRNPTSKIYVADTEGDTQINTGREIGLLAKKAVYKGEGTTIETKANSNASIVLSNGTGVYFDVSTRSEIRAFVQAPFRPGRTDMEEEPSISRTRIRIDSGVLGFSTSRMAAGSSLVFETSLATIEVHGRQAVIRAADNMTVISMFEGDATVQPGPLGGSHEVKANQQMIVRPGRPGQANTVEIVEIPEGSADGEKAWLYERVLTADAARKLVYFEMQAGRSDEGVTLFDGGNPGEEAQQIVVVPVVPVNPPVQPTVSAANLSSR